MDADIICFDLKGLEMQPDMQAIVLFLITNLIWKYMQENPTRKKFLVFDECWKLLQSESGSSFIGEVFRTLRKMNGSAIAIAQTMNDFSESLAANAILPNASTKWILSQKGSDLKKLGALLNLNPNEMNYISSLKQKKGEYSENYLICENNRAHIRLRATPLEYWLATTHPGDIALMEKTKKESPDLTEKELLLKLSQDFPKGSI